jgi:hypothetical protein
MEPFAPRRVEILASVRHESWDLKRYAISYSPDASPDLARFEPAMRLALDCLPEPAITAERVGVGFVILHQGRDVGYLVLAWWDRENELPLRVFVLEQGAPWRPARDSESVCVWDLEVIWAERMAYVETVLRDGRSGRDAYLSRSAPHLSSVQRQR